jgi:lysophospholipase L1-like esterase
MTSRNSLRSLPALLLGLVAALPAAEKPGSPAKPADDLPFKHNDVIMIVGDSLGGPQGIIPLLQKACPEKHLRFFNCSIGTTTIKDAFQRIDRDLVRCDLGSEADVGWYFIMLGANDSGVKELAEGGYESYYRQLIGALKRRTRAKVIPVCTVPFSGPVKSTNKTLASFADVLAALGKQYGLKAVDLFHPCLGFIQQRGDVAFAKDGIHASPEAHVFMAETLLKDLGLDGPPEELALDLKRNTWSGGSGCAVERISAAGAGYHVTLRNRYDFEHVAALKLPGAALDAYSDSGEKLAAGDGRIVVRLPAPLRVWMPDLKQVQALAAAGNLADIANRAGRIQDAVNAAATCTVHLLPPGAPAFKPEARRAAFPLDVELLALWQAAAAPNPADPQYRELQKAAVRLVQAGSDLRLNFPKEAVPATGIGGCRFATSIGRAGPAAAEPSEMFEVAFYNFQDLPLRGTISVAVPTGWRATAAGKTQFEDLPPGRRFVAEFHLTGKETCAQQGELIATADYEVQGVKLQKQAVFGLFAPWLGIGPFCDKKEREKESLTAQLAAVYPPENGVDPEAVYRRYDGKQIAWTPVRSLHGYLGIEVAGQLHWGHWDKFLEGTETEVFTPWQPPVPVYFAQWVYSPQKRDVRLLPIFCSKVGKIWVNRKLLLEYNTENKPGVGMNWTQVRTWIGDPKTVPATLNQGWNDLLIKITSYTPWGDPSAFGCKIMDKDLRPIPGLLGSIRKPVANP